MHSTVKTMLVTELTKHLSDPNVLLLDCRKAADYQAGHIDGAMNSHDRLVESLIRKGDKSRKIIIYCYHGHSSEHLAELFNGFGFTDVYSVQGGYEAWTRCTAV
ncbi:rhodanese-like domain-containing protein [Gynuella sp.]|uniref:rhodanese-like domain-containing protein n=1 Tax=Gynuella sp. TaxID=2969146 RepID=UPI003D101ECD